MTANSPSPLLAFLEDLLYSKVPLTLLPWTEEARELKSYPFKVKTSFWMTMRGYEKWRRSLRMASRIVNRHKIPVSFIELHHHWFNRECDMGVADDVKKSIELCDAHPETVLHELAHLWTQDYHTKSWARHLFMLHKEYLSKEEVAFFQKETVRRYKTARELVESGEIKKLCICGRRVH